MNNNKNNHVEISGKVMSIDFSHESHGEEFYKTEIAVTRDSGVIDYVPVIIPRMFKGAILEQKRMHIEGQFRSFDMHTAENDNAKVILQVLADEFSFENAENENENYIFLDGFICQPPTYRETPSGREISDIMLAVNRAYRKCDYIPCIAWGKKARFTRNLPVGTRIKLCGRIQSRDYIKRFEDGTEEQRTAYEVSITHIEEVIDKNED